MCKSEKKRANPLIAVSPGGGGKKRTKRQHEKAAKKRLKVQKDANANFLINRALKLREEEGLAYRQFFRDNTAGINKYIGALSTFKKKCKSAAEDKSNTFGRSGRGGLTVAEMNDIASFLISFRLNGVVLERDMMTKEFYSRRAQKLCGHLSQSQRKRLSTRTGGEKSMSDLQLHLESLGFATLRRPNGVELPRAFKMQPELSAEFFRMYHSACALRHIHREIVKENPLYIDKGFILPDADSSHPSLLKWEGSEAIEDLELTRLDEDGYVVLCLTGDRLEYCPAHLLANLDEKPIGSPNNGLNITGNKVVQWTLTLAVTGEGNILVPHLVIVSENSKVSNDHKLHRQD